MSCSHVEEYTTPWRGKVPPIYLFSGHNILWDDWLKGAAV